MPAARSLSSGCRFDSLFAQAREPVFGLAPDRRITMVNRAWEELTGHTEAEAVGLECRPHGPTRGGDLVGLGGSFCPPPEALAGQPAGGRTLILRRGGERIQQRVEFWPFHDTFGQLTGLLGIVRPLESPPLAMDAESQSLRFALLDLRVKMYARHAHDVLIGQGAEHLRVLNGIDAAAGSSIPVAIMGEPGTGKRFVARLIHQQSLRRQMPLLGYDCQAIPPEILERELFGGGEPSSLTKGPNPFVAPEGSTLVVGDVLHLPRELQTRLAAALAQNPQPARFIATTSGRLDEALDLEQIKPDLYHALTSLVIRLRPLRDRLDELPLIAQSLLERANLRGQVSRSGFLPAAIDVLLAHDWPGNLRELGKVIDEAHQKAQGDLIGAEDLTSDIRGRRGAAYLPASQPTPQAPLKDRLLAFERQLIEEALAQANQNKTRAARLLGVNRPFLYRRIRELEIFDAEVAAAPPAGLVSVPNVELEQPETEVGDQPESP